MTFVVWSAALLLASGAFGALFRPRAALADAAFRAGTLVAAIAGSVPAVRVLRGVPVADVMLPAPVPGGPWVFGLDAVSAVFLLAILWVGAAAAWSGVAALRGHVAPGAARASHAFVGALLAAMVAVVTARAAVPFLIAWETMAIASYATIVLDHARADVRRAGMLYLVATHVGTLALFGLFALWGAGAGDLTFASLAAHPPGGVVRGAALVAALVGFGMKAGMVPLHFWLPEAHAAAPSHVSAILSGVVIKLGVYGLVRVTLLQGAPPAWWGWTLLAAGVASGVLGVVWALAQHDVKRLLAFHSVENVGIILLGLGAGSLGVTYAHPAVAVLGFAAAALHTLNHALFKALLFLGAGGVAHAAGTRELDRLGAAARAMPVTAGAFLVGAAAIVGLPPLNGFLSEWLTVRALLHAGLSAASLRLAVLAVAVLGLIGALALACFAKVVGTVFLGRPRDPAARVTHESGIGETLPLVALAVACAAVGLTPAVVLPAILRAGAEGAGVSLAAIWPGGVDPAAAPITLFVLAVAGLGGVAWASRALLRTRVARGAHETWGCGYAVVGGRAQYTASSFAAPVLASYARVAGVHANRTAGAFATHAGDPVLDAVVTPAWHAVERVARSTRPLQRGRVWLYLMYLVAALAATLGYLLLAGRAT